VLDLTAEFYLETIRRVFIDHELPRGVFHHRGRKVDLGAIRRCHLMAIEGEKDDITGIGQTRAALELAVNLPESAKAYHLQPGAGHYGIFNGSRFRAEIVPLMRGFMERSMEAIRPAPERASEVDTRPILLPVEPALAQPQRHAVPPRARRPDWAVWREAPTPNERPEQRIG
jgi:poly(3-hydroxybutyrate) depolymerase